MKPRPVLAILVLTIASICLLMSSHTVDAFVIRGSNTNTNNDKVGQRIATAKKLSSSAAKHRQVVTKAKDDAIEIETKKQSKADKIEIVIDIAIFVTVQYVLRTQLHCSNLNTCDTPIIIPYARWFFVVTNVALTFIYANQIYVAKGLPMTEEVTNDLLILTKKLKKGIIKPIILGFLHLKFGIMACLIASSCIAINSLPFWRQRDTSFYKKYGLGRFNK